MEKETTSLMMIEMSHACKSVGEIILLWVLHEWFLLDSRYCSYSTRQNIIGLSADSTIFFNNSSVVLSSPPASLMAILSTCEELCDSILAAVQVGEFAVVQPFSVEYSCILGYLLAWKLLLTFFKSSPSHVSHEKSWLCIVRYLYNMLLFTFSFSVRECIHGSRFIHSLERVDFAVWEE